MPSSVGACASRTYARDNGTTDQHVQVPVSDPEDSQRTLSSSHPVVDPFPRKRETMLHFPPSRARCNLSRNPATTIRTQTSLERIASNALIRDDGPRAFLHLEKLESNFMGGRKRVETSGFLSGDKMLHRCVNNNASEREKEKEREFFVQGVQLICLRIQRRDARVSVFQD